MEFNCQLKNASVLLRICPNTGMFVMVGRPLSQVLLYTRKGKKILRVCILSVSGGRGARSVLSESAMNPFITQSESRMFIKAHRGRRGVSCTNYIVGPNLALDCLDETICECNKPLCSVSNS